MLSGKGGRFGERGGGGGGGFFAKGLAGVATIEEYGTVVTVKVESGVRELTSFFF